MMAETVMWPNGKAAVCKTAYVGSIPTLISFMARLGMAGLGRARHGKGLPERGAFFKRGIV